MGYVSDMTQAATSAAAGAYHASPLGKTLGAVSSAANDLAGVPGKLAVLALSKAWIGLSVKGIIDGPEKTVPKGVKDPRKYNVVFARKGLDRFDRTKLYSLQLGDYFMPLSQTFTVKARKKLNVSQLVDGPDIIQQTRKEAKTIECVLRIGINDSQKNLQLLDVSGEIAKLNALIYDLYESDRVFEVDNEEINNVHGVTHAIMTEYRFIPRVGMGTYTFEFSITEVKYGDNVVTFDMTNKGGGGKTQSVNGD